MGDQSPGTCICGSITHTDPSSNDCPLNVRRVRPRTTATEEFVSFVQTQNQTAPTCPSCGSSSHRRSTHRDCPANPRRQQAPAPAPAPALTPAQSCSQCGSPSHGRRTHSLCPFNPLNFQSQHGAQYKIALRMPFQPENIFGRSICHTPGPNYRRSIFGRMEASCHFCNAKMWIHERTANSSLINPRFGMCCTPSGIQLPLPRAPSQEIIALLTNTDPSARDFRRFIRAYNNMFSFASIRWNWDEQLANGSNGVSTFRINGAMYHRIGSLRAENYNNARFSQIYFADTTDQLGLRTSMFADLNTDTIALLQQVMERDNPFVRSYMSAAERYRDLPIGSLQATIRTARHMGRRYDPQSHPEVAALVVEQSTDGRVDPHDIVLHDRAGGALETISSLHSAYIPLHYVLMFPFGDQGWYDRMQCRNNAGDTEEVTLREYCAYMLMVRDGAQKTYHHYFGRLFQQMVVDNYVRIESSRLNYLRSNQDDLRSELYRGIGDGTDPRQVGRSIVLPSSFTGGPRYMKQMLQDSLAITHVRGNPSLFITFTCNPKWPEITDELFPGQTASDRPDLCARVFNMKMKHMIKHIRESKCFGRVEGYIATVEFQKRGLPHVHMLFILHRQDRPRNPSAYDKFVCAELPDPVAHPQLYRTVTSTMIHGPCGPHSRFPCCAATGRCEKGYPKSFCSETRDSRDGYPVYRRRNNTGQGYFLGEQRGEADNRWVIPYNPYLSHMYDSHINVEICTTARAVKYICKYITKGTDRAQLEIASATATDPEPVDEITQYQNARYIGPSEAIWRTLKFDLHMHDPPVVRLQIHLPSEQYVTFHASMSQEQFDAVRQMAATGTTLLGFFALCAQDEFARTLCYSEVPYHYTWDQQNRQWRRRARNEIANVVPRIYSVGLSNMPLYCLRLLLLRIPGPTSFAALLANGDDAPHPTFEAAALARGYLESDEEWDRAMTETSLTGSASSLRRLFTCILMYCSPADPLQLWDKHRERMADDYFFQLRRDKQLQNEQDLEQADIDRIYQRTLGDIDVWLQAAGHRLSDYPSLPQEYLSTLYEDVLPVHALAHAEFAEYPADEQSTINTNLVNTLNDDQRAAYNTIVAAIREQSACPPAPRIFFLDGPGGTGKSQVFKALLSYVRSQQQIALPVASSGIAAILLPGGRTAHSRFKIPLNADENSTCYISLTSSHAHLIKEASVIIWDEAVMSIKHNFEAVDKTLKDIMGARNSACERVPFGGKVVVFGGDFRQLLPIIKKGNRSEIVAGTIQSASFWRDVRILPLTINMRVRNAGPGAANFADFLLAVGDSRPPHDQSIQIPSEWLIRTDNSMDLILAIYPDIRVANPQPDQFRDGAILAAKNSDVDAINQAFEIFPGEAVHYNSNDRILDGDDPAAATGDFPPEFLNSLDCPGIPPHRLELKVGMPLVLLRNLDPDAGLCNGTKLFVTRLLDNCVGVRLLAQSNDGPELFLPRIPLSSNEGELPFILCRRQFPVRPAFAMTIHKAQGQTLSRVGLRLHEPVFAHGQLYVALSRTTDPGNLRISVPMDGSTDIHTTPNVVYPEVLLRR